MSSEKMSIRKKIIYGIYSLLTLVMTTALITYGMVLQVERKAGLVEIIDDFLNTTLELRRFEKNYFLYNMESDHSDNLLFLEELRTALINNRPFLLLLVTSTGIEEVENMTAAYREKMTRLHILTKSGQKTKDIDKERALLQSQIRDIGKRLTSFGEQTASIERAAIKKLLKTSRTILVVSAVILIFLSFALATLLGRKIVSSLKLLEGYTQKIAHGEMIDPPQKNVEREIDSLFQAFYRMTNELRLRQRQLVQSEKLASLGTLLAGVAHELNNPLSNISTSAQIMAEELDNPDRDFHRRLLDQIEEQTGKARDIVRSLLEFSRAKEFHKENLALRVLITSTIQLLRSELQSNVKIQIDVAEDIFIYGDKQGIQQVFLNLIKNSVDALGGDGNIWISVKKITPPRSNSEIEILFEDDGPGIDPVILAHIFDPFFTTKDVGKGSGLGLFIVHDIIESHGGIITVDSRLDQGTTFIIWLPGEEGGKT